MIETQEHYGLLRRKAEDRRILDVEDVKQFVETIEALRRYVKAHDKVDAARIGALTMDLKEFNILVAEFTAARRALPDWIIE